MPATTTSTIDLAAFYGDQAGRLWLSWANATVFAAVPDRSEILDLTAAVAAPAGRLDPASLAGPVADAAVRAFIRGARLDKQ